MVYSRIAQNRIKTDLLVSLAVLSIIPFLAALGWGTYRALGWFAFLSAPLESGYEGPWARMRNLQDKLAATPPEKLARLYPEYQRLSRDETRLFDDQRAGRLSPEQFREGITRLNAESERLTEETELLVDPQGVHHREEKKSEERNARMWLTPVVTLSIAAALGIVLWGFVRSPTERALRLSGARPAGRSEAEKAAQRLLETLAISAGLPPPKLYVIDSMAPNAFAAGMDPAHTTIAVTAGLLQLLDPRELEGVLSHELVHIGNRDTRLATAVFAITLYLRLPSLLWKDAREDQTGFVERRVGPGRMISRVAGIFVSLYVFFVAPALAVLIRAAVSRGREFLADAEGASLTGSPDGLLRALTKIAAAGPALTGSNPIASHLYFADPSEDGVGTGFFSGRLLASHPHIQQRITRLLVLGAAVPAAALEDARKAGERFAIENPPRVVIRVAPKAAHDELAILADSHTSSRAFRLAGTAPVTLYERDDPQSFMVARLNPGTFLVGLDYHSKMRQVITQDHTFGFIPRAAPLEKVEMAAEEVFHMTTAAPPVSQPPLAAAAAARVQQAPPPAAPNAVRFTLAAPSPVPPETAPAQPAAAPAAQPSPPSPATTAVPGPQPRLSSAQTLVWTLVGILAVGGLMIGIVLAVRALANR